MTEADLRDDWADAEEMSAEEFNEYATRINKVSGRQRDIDAVVDFAAPYMNDGDAAVAINAACQAASDRGGGAVILRNGTYALESSIGPPDGEKWYNVRLCGESPRGVRWTFGDGALDGEGNPWKAGAYLRASANVPVLTGWWDCCEISYLALDADMRGSACANVHLNHTNVQFCEFNGWSGYGLLLNNGDFTDDLGYLNHVQYCNFGDNGEVNGHAIQVEYRYIDSWISDNNIEAGPNHADIVVKSGGPLRILRNHLNGNRSPRHNLWFDGGIRECIVAHNIFEGAKREPLRYDAPGWLSTPEYALINVSDNIFRQYCQDDADYSAILLNGVGLAGFRAEGFVVANNTFSSDYHAAHIVDVRNCRDVIVIGNQWSHGMEDTEADPVVWDGDSQGVQVLGNSSGNVIAKTDLDADTQASLTLADGAEQAANKGQPNGYAGLDALGTVPADQLPGGMHIEDDDDDLLADVVDVGLVLIPPIQFGAAAAVVGVTSTDRAWTPRTLNQARMRVAVAPLGSDLTAEVQHYADGLGWATIGTLTIADGSIIESVIELDQFQAVDDLVRLNITSAGLTTAATGVVVEIFWSPELA